MQATSLIEKFRAQLQKALAHLEYSATKVRTLSSDPALLDEESLEAWEGFVARFSRTTDIFLMKFIRAKIRAADPGFRGTFRDMLDEAEKFGYIDSADTWFKMRELRNEAVHEYPELLESLFTRFRANVDTILAIKRLI